MAALVNMEICVVGGGPAGLAAAIALRQVGCSVMVLDCAVPPIDKACGEALMPDSLKSLSELGISIPAGVGYSFGGIRFAGAHSSVTGHFSNGNAIGLRRTVLHEMLAARAAKLGVALHWNTKGVRLSGETLIVAGEVMRPKLIVAADGQHSKLRRVAGLNRASREVRRYGFRQHYRTAPWSPYMELHWGKRSQLYITPISRREIGIALLSKDPKLRLGDALREFPGLYKRLSSIESCSMEMGAATVSRKLKRLHKGRVVLVGDASGSVDAITGEGMGLSFRQALALARAYKAGDLSMYARAHRRLSRKPAVMASLLLALSKHEGFRRRALASLAKHPDVFSSFLDVHVGESSFANLWSSRLLNLGLTFLAV